MNVYDQISREQIDDSGLFDIRPFLHDAAVVKDLADSIRISGLLSPPVLLQRQEKEFDVICGRQRLKCVFSELAEERCWCRILKERTPPERILSVIIEDQYSRGMLSIIEQAHFISLSRRLIPETERRTKFLGTLPAGRITKGTGFLLPLTGLHAQVQLNLHQGILSEKIIRDLKLLGVHDQLAFLELVERLRISGNNQRKVLAQLTDIIRRDELTLESLLSRKEIEEILDDIEAPTPQKSGRFFHLISQISQPLLSAAKESFTAEVQEMKLPGNCSLTPSCSFEKDEVTLTVRYRNLEEAQKSWAKLRLLLDTAYDGQDNRR